MGNEDRRERRREWDRRYLEKHPEKRKESVNTYNAKAEVKERRKIWLAENRDRYTAAKRRWYENNKEQAAQNAARYAKENPEWKAAQCAKRRARKLRSCPSWLTDQNLLEIEWFYQEAKRLKKETGIPHHVDHIVPLQGKGVSGLHVPWNLQILTASDNSKKGNRFEDY